MNQIEINNKKMHILVISLNNNQNDNSIVESKEIICPKCYEQCRIKIDDYIINWKILKSFRKWICQKLNVMILKLKIWEIHTIINFICV